VTKFEKEYTLADFLALLRHRRILIFSLTILLGVFFVLVALASDPVYQSSGSLQVSSQAGGLGAISEYLSMGSGSPLVSEVEILRSRTVAQNVIDELGLRLEIRDVTYPNPVTKASMFVLKDGLARGLRSFRVSDVEFPPSSVDKKYFVTMTGENNGFRVTGPSGDLGSGTMDQRFESEEISFTAIRVSGNAGARFKLTPKSNHATLKSFSENLRVAPLGSATRTNLIQVRYKNTEPTLAAAVVNAVMSEYDRLDTEWKLSQGEAQTGPIEDRLEEIAIELAQAEDALEAYKNEHGVISLPDEARLGVANLVSREAEKADLNIRISTLQGVHRSLAADLNNDTFAVPPSLTGDTVIQQLAIEHARMMIELEDLLLDYTENHPLVITQRSQITGARESILGAISSTTQGLIGQRNDIDGIISGIESNLYNIPGVERNLLDLTRDRNVAEEINILLIKRLNEARIVTSSIVIGNRTIDSAVPPVEPDYPSIKRNGGIGLGAGLFLGIALAFLLEAVDPRFRRKDQITHLLSGAPVAVVRRNADEDINIGAGILSLAALKSEMRSLALVCPANKEGDFREIIEQIIKELARGTKSLLLVDPVPGPEGESFFGVDTSKGLSELASGQDIKFPVSSDGRIQVVPPGSSPAASAVTSQFVRSKISSAGEKADMTLFWLPGLHDTPALRGWFSLADGAVLVLRADTDNRAEIKSVVESLDADAIPLRAVLIFE